MRDYRCPVCRKNKTVKSNIYGILPCEDCKRRQDNLPIVTKPVEFAGERIPEEREQYAKSIIQPFRRGELSKEYLDAHGTKGIEVTDNEVANAREVWSDIISANVDIKKTK